MAPNPTLVPASLMSQYLAKEKIATRHWLQCQMECLLDQVFDQLSTKFEDYFASNAITGTAHHITFDPDAIQHQQINEPPFGVHSRHQFKVTTTDQLINSKVRFNVGQSQKRGQMMNFNEQVNSDGSIGSEVFDLKYPHSLSVPTTNLEQSNQNDNEYENDGNEPPNDDDSVILVDSDEEEVKFADSNKQTITTVYPHSAPNCSNLEQSNQNDDDDDDEHGLNGYDDNQQQNDHMKNGNVDNKRRDEESFRPNKKPKLETTQSNNLQSRVIKHSTRDENRTKQTNQVQLIKEQPDEKESNEQTEPNEEADEPNEVNNNNEKQIITIRVQCHETDCPQMFNNKAELNHHMFTQHDILTFRCLVKDCKQSFTNQISMSEHMNQVHPHTTQWHCDKCPKRFPAYPILYRHNYHNHQLGQYKCSFANCTFTGGHRRKVFDHYKNQHKPTVELICEHCGRRFSDKSNFKRHQEAHLGIKPYRCKWPNCGYASTHGPSTIIHIRRMHLNQGSTEASLVDPRDYLEVVR